MTLGPLEYVAIGVQNDHGMAEILPVLHTIEESGALRVLDLLVVSTDATGTVTIQEANDIGADAGPSEADPAAMAPGMLTVEDVQTLARTMPADATAVVVLLEHLWAQALTEAVQRAGAVLYTGGLISPEALTQVEAEGAATAMATAP